MADNDEFDDDEFDGTDEENNQGPAPLRKQNRKLSKEVAELREQLAEVSKKNRSRSISDHFTSKGLSPKLASLVPVDNDGTEASLDAWLSEYGDVFGVTLNTEDSDAGQEDATTRAAQERIANATQGADSQGKAEDVMAKIAAAQTPAELTALLANAG